MEAFLSILLELVLSALALIASKYVIPWLKEKRMLSAAELIVEAVEQTIRETGVSQEKYQLALSWLSKKFKVSEDQAQQIIEAAVYKMKNKK